MKTPILAINDSVAPNVATNSLIWRYRKLMNEPTMKNNHSNAPNTKSHEHTHTGVESLSAFQAPNSRENQKLNITL